MAKKEKKVKGPIVFDPPHRGFMVKDDDIRVIVGTSFPLGEYGLDLVWDQLVGPVSVEEFRRLIAVLQKANEELIANGL